MGCTWRAYGEIIITVCKEKSVTKGFFNLSILYSFEQVLKGSSGCVNLTKRQSSYSEADTVRQLRQSSK